MHHDAISLLKAEQRGVETCIGGGTMQPDEYDDALSGAKQRFRKAMVSIRGVWWLVLVVLLACAMAYYRVI